MPANKNAMTRYKILMSCSDVDITTIRLMILQKRLVRDYLIYILILMVSAGGQ